MQRTQRGISLLLEVMLGFGVFVSGLLLVFGIFPMAYRSFTQAKNLSYATGLARLSMEEVRRIPFGSLVDGTTGEVPIPMTTRIDGRVVTTEFTTETAISTLTSLPPDDYASKLITVTIRWIDGEQVRAFELKTVRVGI